MSVLLIGLLLAAVFFGLSAILRRHGDERLYNRVTIVVAAIVIVTAWGLFAATQLGFIPNHAP
jgi:uncharacterized membrane protein